MTLDVIFIWVEREPMAERKVSTSIAALVLLLLSMANVPTIASGACCETPQQAWASLLAAMRSGDLSEVQRLTTSRGYSSLRTADPKESPRVLFHRLSTGWGKWAVRWKDVQDQRATAMMGPELKEHGLEFVRTAVGWRLDHWSAGE
ncbi:MAG: hypothetical protein HXY51_04915 [Nitrospirae bacterium]|nr:hypothetical protein [Nitrospirota bacterium]